MHTNVQHAVRVSPATVKLSQSAIRNVGKFFDLMNIKTLSGFYRDIWDGNGFTAPRSFVSMLNLLFWGKKNSFVSY